MFIEQILPRAGERLAIITTQALVPDAAEMMLTQKVDILVVCSGETMAGVLTKTDIITQVQRHRLGYGARRRHHDSQCIELQRPRSSARCMAEDENAPLPAYPHSRCGRPAAGDPMRDALQGLWNETEIEDEFLRDYIAGVSYR